MAPDSGSRPPVWRLVGPGRGGGARCSIAAVTTFHVAAALFALLVLARNGRRALALFDRTASPEDRSAALVPLIACGASVAVLLVADA